MANEGRVIVGCAHGEEDSDRVVTAYLTAVVALDQGKDVVMWLTVGGVRLALQGYADRIRADMDPPVERVHGQFTEEGAAVTFARSASTSATSTPGSSSRARN